MANVGKRAQLILVTGLLVAIAMVALTLLLNTIIYTQNLASRDTTMDPRSALHHQAEVTDALEALLAKENEVEHPSHTAVEANVTAEMAAIDALQARQYAKRDTAINTTIRRLDRGATLRQSNASRDFTAATGEANWTLATDATGLHKFRLDLSGGLTTTTDPNESFAVTLEGDAGNVWSLHVYTNATTGLTSIAVKNGSESSPTHTQCSPSATPGIDLINRSVDGVACPEIAYAKGINQPYNIAYTFGNRTTGTYNATLNTTGPTSVNSPRFHTPTDDESPYEVPVVYSAVVELTYRTTTLTYRSRLRVVPGDVK